MSFLCPPSCLIIWSRETGSAVPSHVSPLILHTKAEASTGPVVLKAAQVKGAVCSDNPMDELMRSPRFPRILLGSTMDVSTPLKLWNQYTLSMIDK